MPTFDGQTIVSIVVGAGLSLLLFWLGYKKTFGAQEERIRHANYELIASVQKRVAVERQRLSINQFYDLRRGKSFLTALQADRLIGFEDALACVLVEVVDNGFLDQISKNEIIHLIEESRTAVIGPQNQQTVVGHVSAAREGALVLLGISSAVPGALAGSVAGSAHMPLVPSQIFSNLLSGQSDLSRPALLVITLLFASMIFWFLTTTLLIHPRWRRFRFQHKTIIKRKP